MRTSKKSLKVYSPEHPKNARISDRSNSMQMKLISQGKVIKSGRVKEKKSNQFRLDEKQGFSDLQLLTEEDEMLVNIYRNSARGSSNNIHHSPAQEFTRASGDMPVKIDLKKDASSPRKGEHVEVERSVWQFNIPKNQSSEEKMIKPLQFTTRDLLKPQ